MSAANVSSIPPAPPSAACARSCKDASRTRWLAESARRVTALAPRTQALARQALIVACAALTFAAGLPSPASAQAPTPPPEPELARAIASDRFRHLAAELRCLVCQNQTLVDSNAPLAQDLRLEVARLMVGGRSDAEIKSFLTDRYGEFVLYRPGFSARTALLWAGPFLLLLIGALAWWQLGRRRPSPAGSEADLARIDELLRR